MEYRFGSYSLRSEERALRRNGEIVALPLKAAEALLFLAGHQGEVVSKEALMEAVWGSDAVEESNLTQNIYRLRRIFDAQEPSVRIETIPRRGYRLVVDRADHSPSVAQHTRRIQWVPAAAIAACIVVASVVALHRSPAANTVPPSYLTGYYYWSRAHSIADVRKSTGFFQRAIQEQPDNPLGYAGLADARISLTLREPNMPQKMADMRASFAAARKAVSLGADSSEAHAAYGQAEALFDDPAIAERELRRAVELDPTSVPARTWYGELLMDEGRIDAAMAQFRAAIAQNSSWTEGGDDLALLSYLRRDYGAAAAYAGQSLAQEPRDMAAPFVLALANDKLRHRALAEAQLKPFARGRNPNAALKAQAFLSLFYTEDGNASAATSSFSATKRTLQSLGLVEDPSTILSIAAMLALKHEPNAAFAWLARVDPSSRQLFKGDARLDPLRDDLRFGHWLKRS
jgi:DNA-binding winged helix-turn-helix (wHTH) protein/Tfp pilus assembly protein PilF